MGRSLRRIKKAKPRIVKRKAKKRFVKSELPEELTAQRPDLTKKLGLEVGWDEAAKHDKNYEQLGFVADANAGFGRNKKASGVGTRSKPNVDDGGHGEGDDMQGEEQEVEENEEALDEDLKAALGRMRSTGKAAPKRLTPHQRQVVEGLVAAHGTNLEAMVLDRKLNKMQHSRGQLQKLIDSFNYWGKGSGVDFRVPHKRLW